MINLFFTQEMTVQIMTAELCYFKENVINGSTINPKFKCY